MEPINPAEWEVRVRTPGKYQGEPAWVSFMWETVVLCGFDDARVDLGAFEEGPEVSIVTLDDEVRAAFPGAPERAALYEDEQGFVRRADLAKALALLADDRMSATMAGEWDPDDHDGRA